MSQEMRVMTARPLNAETPTQRLRTWITANDMFFDRNQGQIPETPVDLSTYRLEVTGEVRQSLQLTWDEIQNLPKAIVANTLECSGNSRSLLKTKASGNPWTIGGVGNAVWGGVWLRTVLDLAGLGAKAAHVAFDGMDRPLGSKGVSFVRSIPLQKAMDSTLLAYEMNGEPLPNKHGFPLRGLALGWAGANCVKWLSRISVLEKPQEGFFMDRVYRVFQKGEDPKSGPPVTELKLKTIITQPLGGEVLQGGRIAVLGAAYAGEGHVDRVALSMDKGRSWAFAEFIGPDEPYAWRQWRFIWEVPSAGEYTIMARATDSQGRQQPMEAQWNALGYGNNGVLEHAIVVTIA
jgi:DMSO/TMAO reductase YedYZ molybdopterin-dependent catalytic subunit